MILIVLSGIYLALAIATFCMFAECPEAQPESKSTEAFLSLAWPLLIIISLLAMSLEQAARTRSQKWPWKRP